MEASAKNTNIVHLHVGIVSDAGLMIMAEELKNNMSLLFLEFQENPEKTWTKGAKKAFAETLRDFTQIALLFLEFQENPEKTWTKGAKKAFAETLRDFTQIEQVGMESVL
eukprot:CAMPEP_0202977798 /NCGR_PEP_ID=MMETSP1396-20130829/84464_1 /ASSEMBLY_ACC=CAM_ASM_000872 /TAXON_ID= /ORGANISM="Pseudokeronopsis sp., Strain Brazil" /LENGTH=109 /DNA_ID=CAMNT_0049716611 /DNA_START=413 /DNA_END=742 /DNA_ORIENTATION=-